ncbi:MAG: HAMP domain-containing sensor histidine kinase, partial [Bdellovibrionota bacterium]
KVALTTFRGLYGDIQSAMNRMASAIDNFGKERHKFVQNVIADLKTPLVLLQSARLLNRSEDETKQIHAAESVRQGLEILSGSLEDLSDIENINRIDTLLIEKVIDLSELVLDVSRTLAGRETNGQIQTSVPSMPVWVQVDPRRLERALIQCVIKVSGTVAEGGKVLVSITHSDQGSGIEIVIRDSTKTDSIRSTGPEIELPRHWISEGGLSMTLAYKVMRAMEGSIVASGMPGTTARITLRLPRSRVVNRGLITSPTNLQAAQASEVAPVIKTAAIQVSATPL